MKVCITSTGRDLKSRLDHRFGRSGYFVFLDTENPENMEVIENPASGVSQGAGVLASQTAMEKKPEAIITGNLGPNACSVMLNANIKVYSRPGLEGTLEYVLKEFTDNKLREVKEATVRGHYGNPGGNR